LLEKHLRLGRHQYAPMTGIIELRTGLAVKIAEIYGADVDPETEVTITAGATEAIFAAITAVVRPGDEVILLEPAYDSYEPVLRLSGGIPVHLPLRHPGYMVDWDRVKAALTDKTRLIMLNFPHNPTGTVLDETDIAALTDLTRDTSIMIISDEVYEHIVFDGRRHLSLLRYPELAARSFVISSFGKTYHTTGWKIGYCVAPVALSREFRKIHQFLTYAVHTPTQHAYADYLSVKSAYTELPAFYQSKRDRFLQAMDGSRFKPLPCQGTYFQLLDYSAVSQAPDIDFARRLTVENKVAAIPPSVFYHRRTDHHVLRFCFAKNDDTLLKAAEILKTV
jgi:methionine transaminase